MKTKLKIVFLVGMGMAWGQALPAAEDQGITQVKSPIEKIYVPRGFTAADQTEVILQGEYTSSCYRTGETVYEVNVERREILIDASSLFDRQSFCLQVMTPFIQTVQLGAIPAGNYDVVLASEPSLWASLKVDEPQLETPDLVYAPVERAELLIDRDGKQSLLLAGELPHFFIGCMVIREVVVDYSQVDLLQVKPLAEIVDGPECEMQADDKKYELRQGLAEPFRGEGLLHVRGYQGMNFNTLISGGF